MSIDRCGSAGGDGASQTAPVCRKWRLYSRQHTVLSDSFCVSCVVRAEDGLRHDEKLTPSELTTMAMSNLYSKISTKPMKRFQDNVAVKQTNAWMNAESPSNTSDSPPSVSPLSSSIVLQREGSNAINQPLSAPASPLSSLSSPITQLNLPSPGDCTQDPNWQATKPTVRERNAAMFNNHLMADIIFIVGSPGHTQTIPAHKYVLATGSSVFYAMFYGGLPENKRDIEVPDVEPAAFLALLRYMYCDEVQLEADTVLATLYVAKKYIVPHLARACVNYLETSLTAKNACLLLSQSRLFEEPNLMQRCWEVIDAQVSQTQRSLKAIALNDKNLDETRLENDSSPSSDSINPASNLHSYVYDSKFDNFLYQSAYGNSGLSDNTCDCLKGRLSMVPHCLSLSENDCCTNILADEHLSFSLFRTRSEPYFPDNKLDHVEVTQNITYQDNLIDEYECGKINRNDVLRVAKNTNQIIS